MVRRSARQARDGCRPPGGTRAASSARRLARRKARPAALLASASDHSGPRRTPDGLPVIPLACSPARPKPEPLSVRSCPLCRLGGRGGGMAWVLRRRLVDIRDRADEVEVEHGRILCAHGESAPRRASKSTCIRNGLRYPRAVRSWQAILTVAVAESQDCFRTHRRHAAGAQADVPVGPRGLTARVAAGSRAERYGFALGAGIVRHRRDRMNPSRRVPPPNLQPKLLSRQRYLPVT
jgi:hypothetical protein